MRKLRRRKLRKRYGHMQVAGTLSHLKVMEDARRAYRSSIAQGKTSRGAHKAAFDSVRHVVGAGAWDIATRVQKEIERPS
jgi:hypothetical protein